MSKAFIVAENIVSPLGFTAEENFNRVSKNETGICTIMDESFIPVPFSGARIDNALLEREFRSLKTNQKYTRLEKMMLLSVSNAILESGIDAGSHDTIFVYSTTKGNIDLLRKNLRQEFDKSRVDLWATAKVVTDYFNNPVKSVVLSNACITGVAAIIFAAELVRQGRYRHAVVCGMDELTQFVVSGFQSFLAISPQPCRPFDADRNGISLGEACATVVLSQERAGDQPVIEVIGGATRNDANHISGPSRTGEGLVRAIERTFRLTNTKAAEIDFISAHGTATPYNDEMEAIALSRTKLDEVPVNSFKGYYGHTLGAAGILETVLTSFSMKNNLLIRSLGYSKHGVSVPINIIRENRGAEINTSLKLASGFGGCNAAMVLKKT